MATCFALAVAPTAFAQTPAPTVAAVAGITLPGHVPTLVGSSTLLGPVPNTQSISLALTLPLRNQKDVATLIHNLHDVKSPMYGQYLTPQQFTDQFGPTQADYDTLTQWATAHGLIVTGTNPTRTLLDVTASASAVQSAFNIHLLRYSDPTGREFYAPDADPTVDQSLVEKITGVIGLDNAAVIRPAGGPVSSGAAGIGNGPNGGLAPNDIKTAYNLNNLSVSGAGQTLAVFELDGYNQSDIATYETRFHLPNVIIQPMPVDQQNPSAAGPYTSEVAGDIEMQIALAPGASKILVYEAPLVNSTQSPASYAKYTIDEYSRVATDNLARQISTSWYITESGSLLSTPVTSPNQNYSTPLVSAENSVFEEMAAQGQTLYAASGDYGAYATAMDSNAMNHNYGVIDPASQPYVCAVGGTILSTSGPGGARTGETTWMGQVNGNNVGSGGGISSDWPIPFYQSQSGVLTSASLGSYIYRNIPDVALNASNQTPYAIYYNGSWQNFYGTSFAAPLWAAFTALVNQQRTANGFNPVGFINQYLYQIGTGLYGSYASDFHDIADGSTNYLYPAVSGYDLATGWGSLNGASLLADLAARGGAIPDTAPLYRLSEPAISGHLYSIDPGEWHNSVVVNGSHYEGVQCHVYYNAQDAPGLTPFYRTSNAAGDHLYTIYYAEYRNSLTHGARDEGVECYVFPDGSTPGSVPLYRTYTASSGQHFYTTSHDEFSNSLAHGGTADGNGIVAYVLPP